MAEEKITLEQFGQKVKTKYPQYKDIPDTELANKMLIKYPEYKSSIVLDTTTTVKTEPVKPTMPVQNLKATVDKPEQNNIYTVELKKFGYDYNLDQDNPNNLFAQQRATEYIQGLEKATQNYTDEGIQELAVQKINDVTAKKQQIRNALSSLTPKSASFQQTSTASLRTDEEALRNRLLNQEKQLDEEAQAYKQFFTEQRLPKLLVTNDVESYSKLAEQELANKAIETAIKLNTTGSFLKERAELGNAFEIDYNKGIPSTKDLVEGDPYKMSSLDREKYLSLGSQLQVSALQQVINQNKEYLSQIDNVEKETLEIIGNNKPTAEQQRYLNELSQEKQRALAEIKTHADLEARFTNIASKTAYIDKQKKLDEQYSYALDYDKIQQDLLNKGYDVQTATNLAATSHILSSVGLAASNLGKKLLVDIPSYLERRSLRADVEGGKITELEELQQNLQRTSQQEQDLLSLGLIETPSYFKDQFGNKKQLFGFNEKGFYVNPEVAVYEVAKTTGESLLLASPVMLTGGLATNVIANKLLQAGTMMFTSELLLSEEMIRNFEKQGISSEASFQLGKNLARLEGFTESFFIPETKLFSRFVGANVEDLTEDQIKSIGLKNFAREFGIKEGVADVFGKYINIKNQWVNNNISKAQALKEMSKLFSKTTLSEYKEELVGELITPYIERYVAELDPTFTPEEKDFKEFLQDQVTTLLTVAATMTPMASIAAKREYQDFRDKSLYIISQNPEYYIKSIKKDFDEGRITQEELIRQSQIINNSALVSELSKPYFDKIDAASIPSTEKDRIKTEIFSNNNKIEDLKRLLTTPISEKQKESIVEQIDKLTQSNLSKVDNPKSLDVIISELEKAEIQAVNSELSPKNITSFSKQQIEDYKKGLQELISFNTSPNLNEFYQEKINFLNNYQKIEIPLDELSTQDYASQVLNLSKKEVEDLEARGELEEIISKDKSEKTFIKNVEIQIEELSSEPDSIEKFEKIAELKDQFYENNRFETHKDLFNKLKSLENSVTIAGESYQIGEEVEYQGSIYSVDKDYNTGEVFLVDKQGKIPSLNNPQDIKRLSQKEEIPTEDIEAKKADIERSKIKETVYHGTGSIFNKFDKNKLGEFTGAVSAKLGFFFTDDKAASDTYAQLGNEKLALTPEELKDKRRLELSQFEVPWTKEEDDRYESYLEKIKKRGKGYIKNIKLISENPYIIDLEGADRTEGDFIKIINKAKKEGYDAVIIKNTKDDPVAEWRIHDVYIVFEPEQIIELTDAELTALEQPKVEEKPVKPVISTEELIKLAADKYNSTVDTIIRNKKLQSVSKRLTGEKYIPKMDEAQRAKLENYLLDLKSKKELKQEKLKDLEQERQKNKQIVENSALKFKLKTITAIWNSNSNSFEFYNSKFDKVTENINKLTEELSNKPNVLKTWWESLASTETKDAIIEANNTLIDLLRKTNGIIDVEPTTTPEYEMMSQIKGNKFSKSDASDFTDVSDNWFGEKARTISDFANDLILDPYLQEGALGNYDEDDLIDLIKDIIREYPNGITNEDLEKKIQEEDLNSLDVKNLQEEISLEYGVSLDIVSNKLFEEITKYEKETQEGQKEEDIIGGTSEIQGDIETIPTEVIEENNVIENTPVINTSEAKDDAKENKRQLDNPVNPFRNTFYNKESVFGKVISKLYGKSLDNIFVTIYPAQQIPLEQLSLKDQEFYSKEENKNYPGKYLVITDKQGNPLLYTPEGELTKDKGAWAIEVFPNTKSETELANAKFEPTNIELQKQRKTREWFISQVKRIFEARKATKPITYNIEKIHQGGYEIDLENPISIKQSIQNKKAIVDITQNGKAYFQIEGESTPNEINRPLFNQKQIDTIIYLVSNKGTSISDTKNKQEFVKNFVGINFFRKIGNDEIALDFGYYPKNHPKVGQLQPKIKLNKDQEFKEISIEELKDILSAITPNISKTLLETNLPFDYYEYNGKTVSKKTYPSYSDFIVDNFYTYNNVSSTEIRPEYYLEVGNPVNSIANEIIEVSNQEPEIEKLPKKETAKPTITEETPTQKTKKERKKYNIKDDTSFKDFLKRAKSLVTKVTNEQEKEAKEWFDSNPISQFINFRDFRNIVNSDAFATWSSSALTLYKDSKFTDLYHEAWHEFSQLYLTKAQKVALYNEAMLTPEGKKALEEYAKELKKSVSKLTDKEKYFAIEEMIAEDFLKYTLAKKEGKELILNNRPKRNSIFRKIANFLKELFTGKSDLQTYYERLYTGNLNKYKRDLDNAFFGTLNKGLEGVVNGEARNLTNAETKQLYQGIDFIFGRAFEEAQAPITLMFEKNRVVPKIYEKILNYFKIEYDKAIERQSKLEPDSYEYEFEERVLDNLQFTIENWDNIVSNHKRYSSFFKVSKDVIKFDEENNPLDTDDISEDKDENNLRESSIVKNENTSSKEAASNETLYLIATLSTEEANPFFPMVGQLVDFKKTWDILTKNLQGTLEYSDLISKIKNLESKYSWAKSLLDRLPDPNKKLLTNEEQRLKAAFLSNIGKPKVDSYEVVIDEKLNIRYSKSAATDERRLKEQWNSNFTNLTPEDSEFIKYDEQDNTYLDVSELISSYKETFPSLKKTYEALDKKQIFEDRLNFLSNFGIVFSEEAISSPEFFNFITDFNSPIRELFKLTQVLESQKTNSYNPIKDLQSLKLTKEDRGVEYFSKVFPKIINKELQYSSDFFTQSVKNSANNTVWQIREWNYISKIYNAINNVEKYPTYQDLIKEPWLKQFSIDSNPYVNGVFLNTIFDLNTGKRRKDKNGNYVTIDFQDYNGMVLSLATGSKNEGKTTTDLNSFEKLVQNFNTLLLQGVQEHLRYGDKSSSFATKISHIWNPVTQELENSSVIIPIDKFIDSETNTIIIPSTAFTYLKNNLRAELIPMKNNFENQVGSNWKYYRENIKSLGIFEGILSKSTINNLIEQYVETPNSDINKIIEANSKDINRDVQNYLKQERKKLDNLLSNPLLSHKDFVSPSLLQKASFEQLKAAYVVNSLLYNIEHTKLVTGDPRFYKAKGGKKDPFKRFSAWSATGNLFLTDKQTNDYIQSKGRAIKDAIAKKLGIEISPKIATGMLNSVIFNDAKYDSKELIKQYTEYFLSKGFSQEQIDKLLEKYTDITEADGQGYITLDEYRESKLRAGSSHWTKAHEDAYQKEADFLAGKRIQGMSEEELVLFVPQKWQYAGTTIDNDFTVPVFYKFSVAPLIPSMIKNTSFEEIHDNLVKQNVGLALFESGSKLSGITNEDGKFNQFYSDYNERTPFTGDYTINPIFYNYLKEQVNVEPELKGKVTFSTQMRKLLHLNLFKEGKPIHPRASELKNRFANVIEKLISLEKENVISQMGAVLKDGKYTFDAKKLQKFFIKEFEERGLPDEVIDFFQVGENGQFTYPLDASNRRDKIEKIIYSIANKRLVQQKVNGEALIQLAATGFELNSDKLKEVKEDAGLPFYRVVDGKTQAMKVKIAFSEKWKPLLKLTHPDGKPIETLDRLNEAIKDQKWLEQNHKAITIVGVRIPVQGLNSQEFMEVYHFLPESAGNVIIVSPYLVAKSGGDFDIDKLTTFFPNLNEEGVLYTTKSQEEIIELKKKAKHLSNKLQSELNKLAEKDEIESNLKDEIETYIFNLFEEDDDIVLEAKKQLNRIIKSIKTTEQKADDLDTQIKEINSVLKQAHPKKGLENELIDIIRETLSLEENFEQLISPNSTDLLEPFAKELQKLEESAKGVWTEIVEFSEIGRQFKSNLVGKYNLGIAAVWNTFFALSQEGGLVLNNEHIHTTSSGKKQKRKTRINLPHNTIDGKISLSGLMDVENEHKISKIFEQAINGFVDIAKDDWIFFINGVKEVVPTMLFTAAAGVNNRNMIAFFNQPIIKRYVKESQKYKSLFVKIKDSESYKYGTRKAIEDIILSTEGITDVKLLKLIDTLKGKIAYQIEQKEESFTYYELKNILDYLNDKSEKDKSLFTTKKLNPSIFENKPLTPEENLQILAHFDELRDIANKVSSLQRSINADTKKASDSAAIYDRRQKLKEVYETGLFPQEPLEKMFNESTVKAFTNTKTGFDAFAGQLFTELLEISNHPIFNKITRELIQKDNFLLFQYKNTEAEKLTKTLKNDFITYLYQNNVFWEDTYNLVFDKVASLFRPKTALANELLALKNKYPDLIEEFPILNQLVSDKNKDKTIVNIKLKSKLSDRDELNSAVYQIRQLLQFNNPAYTQEEQLEIQNFTKKFTKFAIIQSGLNPSIFNLMDLIPNEEYTKGIAPFIQGFKNILDTNEPQASKEIRTFYNKFKINNPIFFSKQVDEEGVSTANYENIRFKNYKTNSASDVTGKKEIAKTEEDAKYVENLPSKTIIQSNVNSSTTSKRPQDLVLFEGKQTDTEPKNNSSYIITRYGFQKPLKDENILKNQEIIDKFIKDIIEKSKKFTNIVFDEKGYGQHLLPENKRTFDYLSNQLYTYFGYQNPNFTPVNPTEVTEIPTQEVVNSGIDTSRKIEITKVNYTKSTPNDKSKGFFFTENLQAYLANRGRGTEVRFDLHPNNVKLDVTATNNQAGIRRNNGIRNLNAFAIISKKYQQNGSGSFVKEEGQFKDTDEDFELFKKYNTEAINEAIAYNKPLVIAEAGIATGKSALPLRFAEWLNNELKTKLGIEGTIKENTSQGYKGYGIFNLRELKPNVVDSSKEITEEDINKLPKNEC